MLLFSRFSILFATPKARYRGLALKFSNTSKRLWSKSIFGKSISKYNFGCPTLNPVYSYMSTKQTMLSALHSARLVKLARIYLFANCLVTIFLLFRIGLFSLIHLSSLSHRCILVLLRMSLYIVRFQTRQQLELFPVGWLRKV